ncbi:DsbA family protein [Ornithinimicrobium pekingense]|uniref:DsbA family protein n=1 Tax=Ornithinimicrobium pekingense TaxID=384677 RepID=UPI0012EBE337|nr:thioredoxin domain-containing protein [Ornithinimicrobium pekingense]
MTEQPGPAFSPPADDSRASSIAWAVAVTVVALVIGLIAWLALGTEGSDGARGPSTPPSAAAPAQTGEQQAQESAPEGTASDDAAAQTPPEEVQQLMLDLQRRDPDDPMAVGEVDAPVVMIEYADYRCPYCAQFAVETRPELQPLVDAGVLRIEFRDFVIFDEQSHQAAVAARAAAAQDLLEPYQTAVFARSSEGHAELERQDLLDIAEEVGVPDLAAFEQALDDPALAAAVDADTAEARSIGLSSTPTFLVNTTVVQGAQSALYFESVIAQEEQRAFSRD